MTAETFNVNLTDLHREGPESSQVMVGEASGVGLRPGQWPSRLALLSGNGPHYFSIGRRIENPDGEFQGFVYTHAVHSHEIHIFND